MKIAENIQKLICLAKEHPELPIIAMVDGEIVGDDCGRWVGDFGSVELGEYVSYNERLFDDREDFKEAYYGYNDDELCEKFKYKPGINEYTIKNRHCTREQYEKNKESEKQLEAYLDEVAKRAFKAAIIVNIDLPNDVEKFEEAVKRHGKLFYKPYRNHWEAPANGNKILDKLPRFLVTREADEMGVLYALTVDGLKWLSRQLKITIKC